MTHLYIEQSTGQIEEVNASIIAKLYELAVSGDLDETSDLKGRLHSSAARDIHMNYLNTNFDNLYITADKVYLTFTDPQVEQIILNQGWGDGVGVTSQDLGQITTFSGSVFGGSNITSFNEYKYFGNASGQPNIFDGCSLLTSIEYPTASTYISSNCHKNNSSLTRIKIDNTNIANIGAGAFSGCSSLQQIELPTTCTTIGQWGFANCTSLSSINLSNMTVIEKNAFENCTSLTSVDLSESSILGLYKQVFQGCSNLSTLKLPSTVTNLNEDWCNGIASTLYITGLDNVSIHSQYNWQINNKNIQNPIKDSVTTGDAIIYNRGNTTVTSIHSLYEPERTDTPVGTKDGSYNIVGWLVRSSGGNSTMNIGLLYLRDISSFGYVTFYRCNITNLVINNTTPPTHSTNANQSSDEYYSSWGNSIFGDQTSSNLGNRATIGTLWVPDSAVATYQADPQYSGLTIKGINTKTNGVDYDLPRYADFSAWEAAEAAAVAQGGHAPQGLIESWM